MLILRAKKQLKSLRLFLTLSLLILGLMVTGCFYAYEGLYGSADIYVPPSTVDIYDGYYYGFYDYDGYYPYGYWYRSYPPWWGYYFTHTHIIIGDTITHTDIITGDITHTDMATTIGIRGTQKGSQFR